MGGRENEKEHELIMQQTLLKNQRRQNEREHKMNMIQMLKGNARGQDHTHHYNFQYPTVSIDTSLASTSSMSNENTHDTSMSNASIGSNNSTYFSL